MKVTRDRLTTRKPIITREAKRTADRRTLRGTNEALSGWPFGRCGARFFGVQPQSATAATGADGWSSRAGRGNKSGSPRCGRGERLRRRKRQRSKLRQPACDVRQRRYAFRQHGRRSAGCGDRRERDQ